MLLSWAWVGRSWCCTRIVRRSGSARIASGFVFDGDGNLATFIDAIGGRTDFERDAKGWLLRLLQPAVPVAGGAVQRPATTYVYDARGRLIRRQDPDGTVLEQSYVAAGPGAGMVAALRQDGASVASFEYDLAGRLLHVRGPDGTTASQEWDEADRLIAEVDPTGARREYAYNLRGTVTQIRQQMLDELGNPQSPAWVRTDVECDAKGRIVRTTTPTAVGSATSALRYDGLDQIVETIGSTGLRTTYAYDARGLVIERREGVGTATEAVYRWTHELGGEAVEFVDPPVATGSPRSTGSDDRLGSRGPTASRTPSASTYSGA